MTTPKPPPPPDPQMHQRIAERYLFKGVFPTQRIEDPQKESESSCALLDVEQ